MHTSSKTHEQSREISLVRFPSKCLPWPNMAPCRIEEPVVLERAENVGMAGKVELWETEDEGGRGERGE